jgi:hypothetical protein
MGKEKPDEHVLEREAGSRLTYILSDWIINKHDEEDYGIDFVVKPTTSEGEQLGTEIDIQLKSSEEYDGDTEVSQTIDTDALDDYMQSRKPVFLMVYDRKSDEIYWELIQGYIWEAYGRDPSTWRDQQTVTIRLDRSLLSETREEFVEVAKEAEKPIYKYVLEESVMDFMRSIASRSEVQKAIQSGESQSIELKEDYPIAVDFKKTAAGMANSEGGTIIFGIDEGIYATRREIRGVEDPESIISRVERRLREVQPEIDPEIWVEYPDNSPVVVVEIPAYQELPHAVDGTFYIRKGTTTEYLHPQELREFFI